MRLKTRRPVAVYTLIAVIAAFSGNAMSAESLQDVMKRRNLSQQDLLAASKTYVPTGKRDEFLLFASGGHGGNLIVIGVPSMRILKYIGVTKLLVDSFVSLEYIDDFLNTLFNYLTNSPGFIQMRLLLQITYAVSG